VASVVVGATLAECIYAAVSVAALSNFMIHENGDSLRSLAAGQRGSGDSRCRARGPGQGPGPQWNRPRH
jgi:hypothetical protein